jgi:uncharacterized protein involved in exopolysaccharide biosynthesis/Mrp family chromosome partitioning ATPase
MTVQTYTRNDSLLAPLRVLRQRVPIVAAVTLALFACAAPIVLSLTPVYRGEAVLLIDVGRSLPPDSESMMGLNRAETLTQLGSAVVNNQVEVIRSRLIVESVVRDLRLTEDPEFNSFRRSSWKGELIATVIGTAVDRVPALCDWLPTLCTRSKAPTWEEELNATINGLLDSFDASNDGKTYALKVGVSSEDSGKAARIANAIAGVYLSTQAKARADASREADTALGSQLDTQRAGLAERERQLADLRSRNRLVDYNGMSRVVYRINDLDRRLADALSARREKDAALTEIQTMLKTDPGQIDLKGLPSILTSPTLDRLRDLQAGASQRSVELGERFGPRHPQWGESQAELQSLNRRIGEELQRIGFGLRSDVAALRSTEASLRGEIDKLDKELGQQRQTESRITELQREIDVTRTALVEASTRMEAVRIYQLMGMPAAQLISEAAPPLLPAFPKTGLMLSGLLVASLTAGILLALLLETLNNSIRSTTEAERLTSLPVFGTIPNRRSSRAAKVWGPMSAYADAFNALRTRLLIEEKLDRQPARVILVTSSRPSEGKSTVSLSLAHSYAESGAGVALIEADLRQPSIARLLALPEFSVTRIESAGNTENAMAENQISQGLGVIRYFPIQHSNGSPQDTLASEQFAFVLRRASLECDVVIIDAPPALIGNDTLLLAHYAKVLLYVVEWNKTPQEAAVAGLRMFEHLGHLKAGLVFNKVHQRRYSQVAYGDSKALAAMPM